MKKIAFAVFTALALIVALGSCATNAYSEEAMELYPLEDYSEVMESELSAEELFTRVRSWLVDNYESIAPKLSNLYWSDMINVNFKSEKFRWDAPLLAGDYAYSPDVSFALVVEFKEHRMRVSMRNVGINLYNTYYKTSAGRIQHSSGVELPTSMKIRMAGSPIYQRDRDKIVEAMRQIAAGTLETSDW